MKNVCRVGNSASVWFGFQAREILERMTLCGVLQSRTRIKNDEKAIDS